jgi:hypothetical protein
MKKRQNTLDSQLNGNIKKTKSTHPYARLLTKSIHNIQAQDAGKNPELTTPSRDPAIQSKDAI